MQSEGGQTGNDGKSKSDCFGMKSIRAKLSRPKIPKIFRKSKGESSVAESESKESLKVDKKSKIKVIPPEEKEEATVPPLGSESMSDTPAVPLALVSLDPTGAGEQAVTEIGIRQMEQSRPALSSPEVPPTLVPSVTTGRVKRKSVC